MTIKRIDERVPAVLCEDCRVEAELDNDGDAGTLLPRTMGTVTS